MAAGGQQINSAAGNVTAKAEVKLRSNRKSIGGAVALIGSEVDVQQGALGVAVTRKLTGQSIGVGIGNVGSTAQAWNVADITLVEGSTGVPAGQFNLAATGPAAAVPGGIYEVDQTGTPLQGGMTLSEAGLLDVGSAAASSKTGVRFAYTEPLAIPDITIYSGAVAGVLPYMGAVYPCEGACPSGMTLRSPEEPNLRSIVNGTWPDGSAQVVVFHGHVNLAANAQTTIRLRPTAAADSAALTPAFILPRLSSISFGSVSGWPPTLFNDFINPKWIWWASSQCICARYIHDIGLGVMQAIIDVHAFANGRVFVEVVIENSSITIPAQPGVIPNIVDQSYVGASVMLDDLLAITPVGGVSSATLQQWKIHQRTRAWYCSGWADAQDPQTSITHNADAMQKHPMFWKKATPVTTNLSGTQPTGLAQWYSGTALTYQAYVTDKYMPWATGRYSLRQQEGTGETTRGFVGALNGWEKDYLYTGDKRPAHSIVEGSYTLLTRHLNWRDVATGACLITHAQLNGRQQIYDENPVAPAVTSSQFFPSVEHNTYYDADHNIVSNNNFGNFEISHQPCAPLIAFMLRPSPVYIELCQKIAVFNHTFGTTTGVYNQRSTAWRARGWGMRNTGIACMLTPDSQAGAAAWKAGMRTVMCGVADQATAYASVPWNTLDVLYDYTATAFNDNPGDSDKSTRARYQYGPFFHHFTIIGWQMVSAAKVMRVQSEIDRWEAGLSYACKMPIRMVLESKVNHEWRLQTYAQTIGDYIHSSPTDYIRMKTNWADCLNDDLTGTIADAPPGVWLFSQASDPNPDYAWSQTSSANAHAVGYAERYWGAFCVCVERDEPGAAEAWIEVYGTGNNDSAGITNIDGWLAAWGDAPLYNIFPRNK